MRICYRTVRLDIITLTLVFNPKNPLQTIRGLSSLGNKELVKSLMDKIDIHIDGGELIQVKT